MEFLTALWSFTQTVFWFVVVLGTLVFIHELGHFIVAKWNGVRVLAFSLGFGPYVSAKIGETDYRLSVIPLGGYVKMYGEQPDDEIPEEEQPYSFTHKPPLQKLAIVLAGVTMNFIFAFVVMAGLAYFKGLPEMAPQVGDVVAESPAAEAGFQPGDRIIEVNDENVKYMREVTMAIITSGGEPMNFKVNRDGETKIIVVTPKEAKVENFGGEKIDIYQIGVVTDRSMLQYEPLGFMAATWYSMRYNLHSTKMTFLTLKRLLTGKMSRKAVSGPIGIARASKATADAGAANLLILMAILSLNLGIINLLPIPVLDGGHAVFYTYEAVTGRKTNKKLQTILSYIGLVLILALMVFVIFNDIF